MLSTKQSKHSSKHSNKEEKSIIVNFDPNNFTIDPALYKKLSDYDKINRIGKGKYGIVFKYRNKANGDFVAFKKVFTEYDSQWLNEITVNSLFHHPTINSLSGIIEDKDDSSAYIITPYYPNGDLQRMIDKKDSLPETYDLTQKYIIIYGIAVGLLILHKNNFIHRDIKPSSILLSEQLEPTISNLDLCTHIDKDDGNYKPQSALGTPFYMPLEIFLFEEGSEVNGKLADVYSFSMTCYNILTGLTQFANCRNPSQLLALLGEGKRPDFPDDFNPAIREFIEECWKQEPNERPTFDEIVRKLGNPEFIERVGLIDYKRFRKYQKKVTPKEFIENDIKKHRSSSSKRSKHSSKHTNKEKENIVVNFDPNAAIDPKFNVDISDFEKVSKIGRGSFAIIDKYKNKTNGGIVVIKEIHADNIIDTVKAQSLFNHPTINSLLGFFEDKEGSVVKIITAYYPNGDLNSYIARKNELETFDMTQRYIILYGIAVGMSILHFNNFIHRDINCTNVLLSDQLEPAIGGFSLLKHIDRDDGIYLAENLYGTPLYTAPEIFAASEKETGEINGKFADIYSYSIICFCLLTGVVMPYKNIKNPIMLMNRVTKGERPEFPDNFNPSLREFVEECWNQEPEKRPTFREIVRKLGSPEFIERVGLIDYKRFRKYQKKVTPKEFLETESTTMDKINPEEPKIESKDDDNDDEIIANIDFNNFSLEPSFIRPFSDFKKIGKIGEGGQAKVFKFQEKGTENYYAVKRFFTELEEDKYLQREITISSKLLHPTLHRLCFISTDDDNVSLFTEFCPNGDLNSMIEKEKKPPEWNFTQKYIVIYGVAAGLYFLHKNNLIHRDVKPGNVLLSNDLEPLITDFGCSKNINQDNTRFQTQVVGTKVFMAPEILQSVDCQYDGKKADVYAYAILCFILMTEILPFEKVTDKDLLNLIDNEVRPEFPDDFNPKIKEFIQNCWKQDPDDRYSFADVLNVLGSNEFIEKVGGIDLDKFHKYQEKVVSKEFRQNA